MSRNQVAVSFFSVFALAISVAHAQQSTEEEEQPLMSFFVTSVGVGNGADLGGLDGADAHCLALAEAADSKGKTWRAYLSTQAKDGKAAVNARDRIGEGPWHNAKGMLIADDLDSLHYDNSNINYTGALNERGNTVNSGGMGNSPNQHDILTGSNLDGTAIAEDEDKTCNNWTNSGEGSAIVGHHDRFRFTTPGSSWNAAHPSRGCSQEALQSSGGDGLFYCFAID